MLDQNKRSSGRTISSDRLLQTSSATGVNTRIGDIIDSKTHVEIPQTIIVQLRSGLRSVLQINKTPAPRSKVVPQRATAIG